MRLGLAEGERKYDDLEKRLWVLMCLPRTHVILSANNLLIAHLCLATILSGLEMNSIEMLVKIRSAITLATCSSSFGSGLEPSFAPFTPAEA
jgi:hypothetical protein